MNGLKFEDVNRKDLFLLVQDEFNKDFSFIDVKHHLLNHVFSEEECQAILDEETDLEQIEKMFFLLTYNERKPLKDFNDGLKKDYSWLSRSLEEYIKNKALDHPKLEPYKTCINHSWIPSNRNVFVYRCDFVSRPRFPFVPK